jgi:hypothetical protein
MHAHCFARTNSISSAYYHMQYARSISPSASSALQRSHEKHKYHMYVYHFCLLACLLAGPARATQQAAWPWPSCVRGVPALWVSACLYFFHVYLLDEGFSVVESEALLKSWLLMISLVNTRRRSDCALLLHWSVGWSWLVPCEGYIIVVSLMSTLLTACLSASAQLTSMSVQSTTYLHDNCSTLVVVRMRHIVCCIQSTGSKMHSSWQRRLL